MPTTTIAERDGIGVATEVIRKHAAERLGQRRAGIGAGEHADQRDADLHGGKEARRIVEQPERRARAAHPLLRHLLQPGAAGGYDRQLRHGEEPVQNNQKGNDEQVPNGHSESGLLSSQLSLTGNDDEMRASDASLAASR